VADQAVSRFDPSELLLTAHRAVVPVAKRHFSVAGTRLVEIAEQCDYCTVVDDLTIHMQDHRPQRELTVERSASQCQVNCSERS
jgi:hypothetical protein